MENLWAVDPLRPRQDNHASHRTEPIDTGELDRSRCRPASHWPLHGIEFIIQMLLSKVLYPRGMKIISKATQAFTLFAILCAATNSNATSPGIPTDDSRLLNNIDSLKATSATKDDEVPLENLKEELNTLWDRGTDSRLPLDPEVVYTETRNACTVEGIYINGYKGEAGQDRIFFYYARPEKITGKIPAYINLTGGSEAELSLWMSGANQCAVIDLEWRGIKNKFRSKWAGGDFGTMKGFSTSLKNVSAYRLVTGIRRIIDYLEQRSEIDTRNIGCGGGSMGGYYTLLAAGVDERLKFGMDELGAGHLADSDSSLGQFDFDSAHKAAWLQAFDPYSYAGRTKAKMFMNLSANDYFFWLGDGLANYQALPGEKRLCITPNFSHNDGAFGKKKNGGWFSWLSYAFGRDQTFPQIAGVARDGAVYTAQVSDSPQIVEATLYWSPGKNIDWPARYWVETPSVKTGSGWQAQIPTLYAAMAHYAFMTVKDAKGRAVSSIPSFTPGTNPLDEAGQLWADGALWDEASGPAAWRLIGPNVHKGTARVQITAGTVNGAIQLAPIDDSGQSFALVTNSLILAAGEAKIHQGLKIGLNGNGKSGVLIVTLVRNFGAVHQKEFSATIQYGATSAFYGLPWTSFKGPAGEALFPFESLRLDGQRPDGSPVSIEPIRFLN